MLFDEALSSLDGSTQYNVHKGDSSTLDPGRHLTSFNMTWFLPLYLPRVASHAASYNIVSARNITVRSSLV
jgi:hypothetical protein